MGVVAAQGKGDKGVPGVFGVSVVGVGDMGLEPTSCPGSRHPGILLPPSLLPDFWKNNPLTHNQVSHDKIYKHLYEWMDGQTDRSCQWTHRLRGRFWFLL